MAPEWSPKRQMTYGMSSGPFPKGEGKSALEGGGLRAPREEETELGGRGLQSDILPRGRGQWGCVPGAFKKPFHPEAREEVGLKSEPGPCTFKNQER